MIAIIYFFIVIFGVSISKWISQKKSWLGWMTTFSGAFLLGSFIMLIFPEFIYDKHSTHLGIWVLMGVLAQLLLESMTGGIEHGHHHHQMNGEKYILLGLGLIAHSFLEGLPSGGNINSTYYLSVIFHKLPIAVIFGNIMIVSTFSLWKKIIFTILFAISSPVAYLVGSYYTIGESQELMAFMGGVFLHISTTIIFESGKKHQFRLGRFLTIALAFAIIIIYSSFFTHHH